MAFPKGELNPAKRPEIRALLREQKLGSNNHRFGKPWSAETREKMRISAPRGKNHHNFGKDMSGANNGKWIEDRTKLAKRQERNDMAYKEWRMNVWKRDNFKCKIENDDCDGSIIAHHILPWRDYVALRYDINNGITLCHFHHPKKRVEEVNLSPYFQELVKNIQ